MNIRYYIKNPKALKYRIWEKTIAKTLSDEKYLKKAFKANVEKDLDLENPKTYNEKLQWLKLYDRKPIYTDMVDKAKAKEVAASIIGEEHIIPTLGIYEKFEDIDFDALPDSFVIKCTHDSGGLVIVKDKSKLNKAAARKKINRSLKRNYYLSVREWPYKNVKPRILIEKYMVDESGTELKDYKFFCFDGKVKLMFIATDRPYATKFDFYDENFNHLPFTNGHPNATKEPKKPQGFDEMIALAEKLSAGTIQLRVDLYNINGKIYFGEFTFFHWGGMKKFEPEEWDYKIGEYIHLPIKN